MKQSDATRIVQLLTQLTESINGPASSTPPAGTKPPLSERIDRLDNRVSEVQLGLATLAANTKAGFDRVDKRFDEVDKRFNEVAKRFDAVDRSIESTRVEIVDLVTRVHSELTGRVIDLEVPQPGGQGSGGSGSGGSGVPLAS
jgi:hypothetical protein